MLLTCQEQFVKKIINGEKIHTIRAGSRWKKGMKIHFWKGNPRNPSKNPYRFELPNEPYGTTVVKSVQKLDIEYSQQTRYGYLIVIFVNENYLGRIRVDSKKIVSWSDIEIDELVNNDGFEDLQDFVDFFPKDFTGQIIHWTDLRY